MRLDRRLWVTLMASTAQVLKFKLPTNQENIEIEDDVEGTEFDGGDGGGGADFRVHIKFTAHTYEAAVSQIEDAKKERDAKWLSFLAGALAGFLH